MNYTNILQCWAHVLVGRTAAPRMCGLALNMFLCGVAHVLVGRSAAPRICGMFRIHHFENDIVVVQRGAYSCGPFGGSQNVRHVAHPSF